MEKETTLTLAYSPCPNDTFLFYHLVHSNISKKIKVKEELHDVEHLNLAAPGEIYDVTKLSFFAFFHILDKYILLNSGSALGRGCGPLLVKKKGKNIKEVKNSKILVPGLNTTANLLLNIYLKKEFEPSPIRYDLIMDKILSDDFDLGVIIHEERFTYEEKGLEKVVDLGEFWESFSGKPIPLGAIGIKRSIENELQMEFDSSLHRSLLKAYENPEVPGDYILENSQVKDEKVVQSHIDLYVNDYTKDLGIQ
ncbi:MAG: 1,4-dihydroxy-6-naphthoate synthase, partial [Leptospiraceae bacterium]|nr:1,4-dihydroxy-6-naphthoate synthase [Leptospiraceae bacterium]